MGDVRDPDEFFDVAEKILEKLNVVFEKDSSLDEFDIVPVESQSNRSPVIHLNHKLALESWCVPFLYSHSFKCFTELLPKRHCCSRQQQQQQQRKGGPGSTTARKSSTASHKSQHYSNGQLTEEDRIQRKLQLSRCLLLLNPDLTLGWNFRREAYLQGQTRFQDEINLVSLVLSRKPKNFECFSYRKWLVKQLIATQPISKEMWSQIFEKEIKAVELAAAAYFSNYHAWDYRRWLLQTSLDGSFSSPELKQQVLISEKALSDEWIEKHVSDHSGIHYRQHLIMLLSHTESNNSELSQSLKLFKKELENNLSFITRYPGHETLWYYRRFLLQCTMSRLQSTMSESEHHRMEVDDEENDRGTLSSFIAWEDEVKHLKDKEKDLVESVLTENSDLNRLDDVNFITKDTSQLNLLYAQRHSKWLSIMFEWQLLDNNKK